MDIFVIVMICLINIPVLYVLTKKYFGSFAELSYYMSHLNQPEIRAGIIGFLTIIFLIVFFEVIIGVK